MLERCRVWVQRSRDNGRSICQSVLIRERCGGGTVATATTGADQRGESERADKGRANHEISGGVVTLECEIAPKSGP